MNANEIKSGEDTANINAIAELLLAECCERVGRGGSQGEQNRGGCWQCSDLRGVQRRRECCEAD